MDILFVLEPLCGELDSNLTLTHPTLHNAVQQWEELKSRGGNLMEFVRQNPTIFGPGFDAPPGKETLKWM
jgi:hypothetical protein